MPALAPPGDGQRHTAACMCNCDPCQTLFARLDQHMGAQGAQGPLPGSSTATFAFPLHTCTATPAPPHLRLPYNATPAAPHPRLPCTATPAPTHPRPHYTATPAPPHLPHPAGCDALVLHMMLGNIAASLGISVSLKMAFGCMGVRPPALHGDSARMRAGKGRRVCRTWFAAALVLGAAREGRRVESEVWSAECGAKYLWPSPHQVRLCATCPEGAPSADWRCHGHGPVWRCYGHGPV
eukprot:364444-Chlamydomonas_euryale.AAC.10